MNGAGATGRTHLWVALGWGLASGTVTSLCLCPFSPNLKTLTERCWNNQALMMLVATLGKIPLFLFRLRSRSRSSSSPAELGEATLVSSPSPGGWRETCPIGAGKQQRTPTPSPKTPDCGWSPFGSLALILRATLVFPLSLLSFSPWSLELSPLWEARPPLDGPGVPKRTDPLSSWSLIHVVF